MLLSSTSTPVLQTLFSESPIKNFHTTKTNNNCSNHRTSAVHGGWRRCYSLRSFSCSPISSGSSQFSRKTSTFNHQPLRRARSEGHLGEMSSSFDLGENSTLQSALSFSIYTSEDEFDGESEKERVEREKLERHVMIGERNEEMGSGEFCFGDKGMDLIEENGEEEEVLSEFQDLGIDEGVQPISPRMYLATGLGIGGDGSGGGGGGAGGGGFAPEWFGGGGDVEEYYKRMVGDDPSSNPLFLRNYAQLLLNKGDLHGAEEYLFQATLADPNDGEICSLYAKLVWELHRDQERALNYFEQATQASPEDSHVVAAYACFLWEIDEEEKDDRARNDHFQIEGDKGLVEFKEKEPIRPSGIGGIRKIDQIAADSEKGGKIEDYYKRRVEENPSNPLFLRNYAQFLHQSKGDLQGAEEYYSRAILADPADGEIISQYASLVWELHRDHNKAESYFERAVQATPQDSHVLAAYAKYLWETQGYEEDEHHSPGQNHIQTPVFLEAMTTASA
ncbi:hypothetical protein RHMOL_Rhmol02G0049000 [Rhododendron molle]|uniref:Uncharacterized protein n=2 Tax=Rhododendron molle TaxID=49168 RepID=A0ACC0PLR4_RHOML|nr:hypothetical protein RHMOL_Rhmol02G0049000 [Rhododendron molle]KAI8566547.1 hypothetical protein RHMOL_Rhmol02G0049000 [Rhododendron molle]